MEVSHCSRTRRGESSGRWAAPLDSDPLIDQGKSRRIRPMVPLHALRCGLIHNADELGIHVFADGL